jgi:cysteine desulfurase family protein
MIYFDNASTTHKKPDRVVKAITDYISFENANPGRSAHKLSINASKRVFEARERIARFFNVTDSRNVIFTMSATDSINMALCGILNAGDHVIISSLEHNSVLRPLTNLVENHGIGISMISCDKQGHLDPAQIKRTINPSTKLIVLTGASNVIGTIMPIKEIGEIAKSNGTHLFVDAAQTAGSIQIDMQNDNIDLLAITGHKHLLGPQGIGVLCINADIKIRPFRMGGTGTNSWLDKQPDFLPDHLEAGTLNVPGIIGLSEAIAYIEENGIDSIRKKESELMNLIIEDINNIDDIILYGPKKSNEIVPVISFNIKNKEPSQVALILDREFDIMSRPGLHCAPNAHKTIGSYPEGTVRFGLCHLNTVDEIKQAVSALRYISEN